MTGRQNLKDMSISAILTDVRKSAPREGLHQWMTLHPAGCIEIWS